jgi:hypothetical protein
MYTVEIRPENYINKSLFKKNHHLYKRERTTVLNERLRTLEILIIDIKIIVEKNIPLNSSYYENLTSYFNSCLHNIKLEIEKINQRDPHSRNKLIDKLEIRIKSLIEKITRISVILNKDENLYIQ